MPTPIQVQPPQLIITLQFYTLPILHLPVWMATMGPVNNIMEHEVTRASAFDCLQALALKNPQLKQELERLCGGRN